MSDSQEKAVILHHKLLNDLLMKEDIRYIKILLNIIIVLLAFVLIGITTLGNILT